MQDKDVYFLSDQTNEANQRALFAKTFGCCRFVYNWAINLKIEAYKQEKSGGIGISDADKSLV